jgi:hypothetical protein
VDDFDPHLVLPFVDDFIVFIDKEGLVGEKAFGLFKLFIEKGE